MGDMVNLHTHTEYSQFDGCGKLTDFLAKAKSQGHDAIAFTEHGTIRQLTRLQEESEAAGIRPIYGVELYLCNDMTVKDQWKQNQDELIKPYMVEGKKKSEAVYEYERDNGIIARYHLTVLAKNDVGLSNLVKITSLGWLKGFYKRARVDMDCLLKHKEGLIVLSGCQSGSIGHGVLNNDLGDALAKAELLFNEFGEDYYGEIMPHNMDEQAKVNKAVVQFSDHYGMRLVSTQDAHYIEPEDWRYQEAMLCLHTRTTLHDPQRFKFSARDFWLKGRADMEESYRMWHGYLSKDRVKESMDSTLEVAEKCQAKLAFDRFKALVPPIPIPAQFRGDEFAYLQHLCMLGWKERGLERMVTEEAARRCVSYKEMKRRYMERLAHELSAFKKQNVVRYFLVVWDIYKWTRGQGIEVGPGRGSVGGSIAAFLLGITDIDPIRFELLFERFLNPDRIDMPDVDMDFEDTRREEVIQYLKTTYGEDHTAHVGTVNKMTGKACLKDIARIMGIPIREIQPVVDAIVQRSSGDERASMTIEDSFNEFPVCRDFAETYPQVLDYAKKLEGQAKAVGIHAAGIVVSPVPLIEVCPLEVRKTGDQERIATAVDMYGVSNLGLMKLDVLGLRNLSAMRLCREAIKERHGIDVDWLKIPMADKPTLDNFTAHNYVGIFQYDTHSADKICQDVEFTSFEDVAAMIALDRPGTARSGLATEYLKRKKDPSKIISIHPIVDEICSDTLGVIVYQEHVMRIFTDVAGFSPATSDSLRRKIAKKYGDEAIAKERDNFVQGSIKNGVSEELAKKLIDQITFFGSYGFNKSHSVAYGLISYREMWLKTHYPTEFMWALLAVEPNSDEVVRFVRAARRMGIEVRPPDVNDGEPGRWSLKGAAILGAMSNIKGVGQAAIKAIAEARPFTDFADFAERINRRAVHRGVVHAMLQAGAMGSIVPNQKWLHENIDTVWAQVGKKDWQEWVRKMLNLSKKAPAWTEEEQQEIASQINPLASGIDPLEKYQEHIDEMRDNWLSMDSEDFWENKSGWIWGRVVEIRYNQVGDFHNGPEPDDETKARMFWGRRYANINIEDRSGRSQRVKVDIDVFEQYRHIIDKGENTIVACHVMLMQRWKSIRASFLIDLDSLLEKVRAGEDLDNIELSVYRGWTPAERSAHTEDGKDIRTTALVTRIALKYDKKSNLMAFVGMLCADGKHREAVCFASAWPEYQDTVKAGEIRQFKLRRDKTSYILDGKSKPRW